MSHTFKKFNVIPERCYTALLVKARVLVTSSNMTSMCFQLGILFTLFIQCSPIINLLVLLYLLFFTKFFWVSLLYIGWMYFDRKVPYMGARSSRYFRHWIIWYHLRDYFPVKLVKTAELDPCRNHLICSFPHGIFCLGMTTAFGTDSVGFDRLYPNITAHPSLLSLFMWLPFSRELVLLAGYIPSSERSLDYVLSRPEGGHAAVLVVGGAAEAALSRPNSYKVIVKRRKGFIRLAFKHGVPLVPVISFGENDIYEQTVFPEGSWMRWFQDMIHKKTGVFPAIPMGRFFLIPYQRPITVVVGKPLEVEKVAQPTPQQMEEVKEKFIKSLVQLFEEHKHKYVKDPENTFMEIL